MWGGRRWSRKFSSILLSDELSTSDRVIVALGSLMFGGKYFQEAAMVVTWRALRIIAALLPVKAASDGGDTPTIAYAGSAVEPALRWICYPVIVCFVKADIHRFLCEHVMREKLNSLEKIESEGLNDPSRDRCFKLHDHSVNRFLSSSHAPFGGFPAK